jgi:hypothetical protein
MPSVEEAREEVIHLATTADNQLAGYWRDDLEEALDAYREAVAAAAREQGAREAQAENARYREALEKIAHDHAAHARFIQCYDTLEERQAASLALGWAQDRAKLALAVQPLPDRPDQEGGTDAAR